MSHTWATLMTGLEVDGTGNVKYVKEAEMVT